MAIEVAVLDDYQHVAESCADWSVLQPEAEVTFFDDHLPFGLDLVRRLEPFEVISAMRERTPLPRVLLEQLPRLRLVVTTGRRNAAIDLPAATDCGITVSGTSSPEHATAELAMALLLSLARNIPAESQSARDGGWQVGLGRDIRGAVLGLIGLGRLGGQVAAMAQAFGMRVVAWSHNLTEERCREVGVTLVDLESLLRMSDFVSIHLRLSDRTEGLLGADALRLMKPGAYLINTSRGAIVEEEALITALEAGTIGGAAVDVFAQEPLPPEHRLRTAPRLLLTPHIGYVTQETYKTFYTETVEAIDAYLRGAPIRVLNS